ncbi:MAG: DNA repair protein RecO [Anaeroplasmataceae bacterium]|nr:DNA repair protein RecO [Anaeroplasmataceae bacterium]
MEGIVLKTIDYKEKSKLVYLYTPSGIISVKALDASKTKLGFITTLNQVEFEMSSGKLPTVIEYSLKKSFYSIYESLTKVGVLTPILDIIFHLEEGVNHRRIYSFLIQTLNELLDTELPYQILSIFLVKMLAVFGIKPELKKCVRCSKTNLVNFSCLEGGALCDSCSLYHERNYQLLQDFQNLYFSKEFKDISLNLSYTDLLDEIYQYYAIHANFKLKDYHL